MRSTFAVAAVALALVAAASRVIANPLGVPPTAKPLDVIEGKTISIELGTPTAHGWYVLVWGSYKVGDQEFLANAPTLPGTAAGSVSSPPRTRATRRMSFSSRFMAGRRSWWASIHPQARMAPFITGSTMRPRRAE
jgi:hypothetical protein